MGGEMDVNFTLAAVEEEAEEDQIERFTEELEMSGLPEEVIQELQELAYSAAPVETFFSVLESAEMDGMITLEKVAPEDLEKAQEDEDHAVVVHFPENFTYDLLGEVFLGEEADTEVTVYHREGAEIAGNIAEQILTAFQEEYTRSSFLGQNGMDPDAFYALGTDFKQEVSSISQYEPVTSMTYYTIGMAVMNVLFMGTTIATYAFREQQSHVFNRMILANISRWNYFFSILLSGMLFAFLQTLFVFGFSYLVFGVSWPDIPAFFAISCFFALAVGGLAVLLTAMSFRFHSEQIIGFFSGIVVTIFAFLGGSFFPIGDTSPLMQRIGDFTPNGAAMSAYLSIIRGETMMDNVDHLAFIACFALGAIIIGVFSFPKRGGTA